MSRSHLNWRVVLEWSLYCSHAIALAESGPRSALKRLRPHDALIATLGQVVRPDRLGILKSQLHRCQLHLSQGVSPVRVLHGRRLLGDTHAVPPEVVLVGRLAR